MRELIPSLLGLSLCLALVGVSSGVSAQTNPVSTRTDGRVTSATAELDTEIRQRDEQSRIDAGIRAGTIDAREAAHLSRAMTGLQAYQERAYADGVLTLREQARLTRLHTRLDRAISRALSR